MAEENEALPPAPRKRGRPKKPRVEQKRCRAKGRFVRCPELGPRPPKLRAHRRVCRPNEPLQCPKGATLIDNPPGPKGLYGMRGNRKQACLLVPPPGQPARFVDAICLSKVRNPLVRGKEPPPPPPGLFSPSSSAAKPKRERGRKVFDWSKCACPPGFKTQTLASGALKCQDPYTSRFVKAVCAESAYTRPAGTSGKKKKPA